MSTLKANRIENLTTTNGGIDINNSGNVGIGTSSPGDKLAVSDGSNITELSGFSVYFKSDSTGYIQAGPPSGSSGRLVFQTNSAERLRIDSSGNLNLVSSASTLTDLNFTASDLNVYARVEGGKSGSGVGDLRFHTYSGGLSEAMRIDSSGNVGIGNTSPADKLHVGGNIRFGANTTYYGVIEHDAPSTGANIYTSKDTGGHIFKTGTTPTERMRIDGSGNVGIGTSGPSYKLHVVNDSSAAARIGGTNNYLELGEYASNSSPAISYNGSGASLPIRNGTSEVARFNSSGRLGVGTSSPGQGQAQINITAAGSDNYSAIALNLTNNSTNSGTGVSLRFSPGNINTALRGSYINSLISGSNGSDLQFWTCTNGFASAERMRIDSLGRLFIGSTTFTSNNTVRVNMSFAGGGTEYGMCMNAGSLVAGTKYITFDIGTTQYGSIGWTGTQIGFYNTSDYRLKENIVDLEGGIERVKQLQPRRFNFTHNRNTTVDGFVAHEAQAAIPEAVYGTHNEVDSNGNPVYQSIDQSKFVPLLTAALQEAIAKIETLETKVAALEAAK